MTQAQANPLAGEPIDIASLWSPVARWCAERFNKANAALIATYDRCKDDRVADDNVLAQCNLLETMSIDYRKVAKEMERTRCGSQAFFMKETLLESYQTGYRNVCSKLDKGFRDGREDIFVAYGEWTNALKWLAKLNRFNISQDKEILSPFVNKEQMIAAMLSRCPTLRRELECGFPLYKASANAMEVSFDLMKCQLKAQMPIPMLG